MYKFIGSLSHLAKHMISIPHFIISKAFILYKSTQHNSTDPNCMPRFTSLYNINLVSKCIANILFYKLFKKYSQTSEKKTVLCQGLGINSYKSLVVSKEKLNVIISIKGTLLLEFKQF